MAAGAGRLLGELSGKQKIYGVSLTLRGLVDSEKKALRNSPYFTKWEKNQSLESILRFFPDAKALSVDKPVRTFARYLLDKNREDFSDKRVLVLFSRGAMAGSLIEHGHIEKGRNSIIGEFGLKKKMRSFICIGMGSC